MLSKIVCILLFSTVLTLQAALVYPQETIRVGILHSESGTMAINERALKESLMMLIEEQNRRGGLLGRQLEPVVLDPASNWLLYAEKARQLIEREKAAVIFGCWTSASRKAVLPVVEELDTLLFYPVQAEGQVGQVRADGQYQVIWQSEHDVPGKPWSPYLQVGVTTN